MSRTLASPPWHKPDSSACKIIQLGLHTKVCIPGLFATLQQGEYKKCQQTSRVLGITVVKGAQVHVTARVRFWSVSLAPDFIPYRCRIRSRLTAACEMTSPPTTDVLTMEAKMGKKRVVVATLLVHSVVTAISKDKIREIAAGDTPLKGSICFPIHSDSPEA